MRNELAPWAPYYLGRTGELENWKSWMRTIRTITRNCIYSQNEPPR